MLEAGLQQLVAANAAVQAILGTAPVRLFPLTPPEDVAYPCATYQVISDAPSYLLAGDTEIEVKRIQIDVVWRFHCR
jgi:hypothetical protein